MKRGLQPLPRRIGDLDGIKHDLTVFFVPAFARAHYHGPREETCKARSLDANSLKPPLPELSPARPWAPVSTPLRKPKPLLLLTRQKCRASSPVAAPILTARCSPRGA